MDKEELTQLKRELCRLAKMLKSETRQGHVDYISKTKAGEWIEVLAGRIPE
jgi:hypothetical protein